jgi:hypothetical protein
MVRYFFQSATVSRVSRGWDGSNQSGAVFANLYSTQAIKFPPFIPTLDNEE